MQQWWQQLGIQLGKQWKIVAGIVAAITVVLVAVGLPRLDFATGQESYLNDDSQIAIDNELFQDMFGGEAIVMMFIADDAHDIADLYREDNGNLAELQRVRDELGEIPEVRSVVDPLTTLTFSHNIVSDGAAGVAGQALLAAVDREEAGSPEQQVRQADIPITLGRLGAIPEDQQEIGNPAWNEFLIFDNTGFAVEDGEVIPPDDPHDRAVRKSLRGVFPEHDGAVQQHVVGGLVLKGNATLDEMSDGTVAALDILDTVDVEGFELVVAGSPIYLKEINDYLRGGMLTLGGAAILVMAIILIVMFRVRWRLLSLAACIIGILWAFSLFGLIGLSLSLVTIAGLPILIGLGIDFAIQIHNRVEEEVVLDHDEHPIQQTLANVGPALVAATVAAVVAFIALQA